MGNSILTRLFFAPIEPRSEDMNSVLWSRLAIDVKCRNHDRGLSRVSKGRITLTPELREMRNQTMLFVFGL